MVLWAEQSELLSRCLQAYQKLESEAERKGMLAGLVVKTEGKERRIGAEISARVYRYFSAQNPQLVLD